MVEGEDGDDEAPGGDDGLDAGEALKLETIISQVAGAAGGAPRAGEQGVACLLLACLLLCVVACLLLACLLAVCGGLLAACLLACLLCVEDCVPPCAAPLRRRRPRRPCDEPWHTEARAGPQLRGGRPGRAPDEMPQTQSSLP
jgi:hypothetical protein